MTPIKQLVCSSYYHATLPLRWWNSAVQSRHRRCAVRVLFYHRVADTALTPWTISKNDFVRQMNWIAKNFRILPLADAQKRIASGCNDEPAVVITFDDGYAENCDFAIPFLLRHRIPFTYFVTTRNLLDQTPFNHDLELGYTLRPNTPDQIRSMAAAGVDIGAHARTHCDLGSCDSIERLRCEITGSREDLQTITEASIDYFAFPFGQYGNLSPLAFRVAYEAGFAGVCSAYGGVNQPGNDPFHIERLHGDPCHIRLKNWVTLDPRRQWTHHRYQTGDYRQALPPTITANSPESRPSHAGVLVDG